MKTKRKIFYFVFVLSIVAGTILTLSQINKTQNTRSRAAGSTTISLVPATSSKQVGDTVDLDMMVNPGSNLITFVKFEIQFDPAHLQLASNPFTLNTTDFPMKLQGPIKTANTLGESVSIGADPTKLIQKPTKIGTVHFTTIASTNSTPTNVIFTELTQALSAGSQDKYSDNVLSGTTPASIAIGGSGNTTPTPPAECINFTADLSGAQEIPANNSAGQGKITIGLDAVAGNAHSITETTNLQLNQITAMHIHSPAQPGENAPASVTLYDDPNGNFTNPYTKNSFALPTNVLADINSGKAYVNIHTNQFPNGEIRGRLSCGTITSSTPTLPQTTVTPGNQTTVSFDLLLHGVGSAGDNPNPSGNSLSNKSPLHPQRDLGVEIYNSTNEIISSSSGKINYDASTGTFKGAIALNKNIQQGNYAIKVRTPRYLKKLIPGSQKLTPNKDNRIAQAQVVAGDTNGDNTLNIIDYNAFLDCGYGVLNPLPIDDKNSLFNKPACQAHKPNENIDINDNGIVASVDYNLFLRELSVQSGD